MNDVLQVLLEITVYSGIIFAATMLFKKAFKNKISPALHLGIWLLLIVRLLLPVTFESTVSFITIPSTVVQGLYVETGNELLVTPTKNSIATNGDKIQIPAQTQQNHLQNQGAIDNGGANNLIVNWNWQKTFMAAWLVGIGISVIYSLRTYHHLVKRIKRKAIKPSRQLHRLLNECTLDLGIDSDMKIIVQRGLASPALMFPNIILIPSDILKMDEEHIRMMIIHELTHYRRKDHILSMCLLILRIIHWFNPFVWIAFRQIREDIETACDNDVVRHWAVEKRNDYAQIVLSMISRTDHGHTVLGLALGSTKRNAEQRIRGIFMNDKSKKSIKVITVLLVCMIGVCCFTTACQPSLEQSIVANENDGELQEIIPSTESTPPPDRATSAATRTPPPQENQKVHYGYSVTDKLKSFDTISELRDEADHIFAGTVENTKTIVKLGNPYTVSEIKIYDELGGDLEYGSVISVVEIGGGQTPEEYEEMMGLPVENAEEYEEFVTGIDGYYPMREGQDVLLFCYDSTDFFEDSNPVYAIVGEYDGRFFKLSDKEYIRPVPADTEYFEVEELRNNPNALKMELRELDF